MLRQVDWIPVPRCGSTFFILSCSQGRTFAYPAMAVKAATAFSASLAVWRVALPLSTAISPAERSSLQSSPDLVERHLVSDQLLPLQKLIDRSWKLLRPRKADAAKEARDRTQVHRIEHVLRTAGPDHRQQHGAKHPPEHERRARSDAGSPTPVPQRAGRDANPAAPFADETEIVGRIDDLHDRSRPARGRVRLEGVMGRVDRMTVRGNLNDCPVHPMMGCPPCSFERAVFQAASV